MIILKTCSVQACYMIKSFKGKGLIVLTNREVRLSAFSHKNE